MSEGWKRLIDHLHSSFENYKQSMGREMVLTREKSLEEDIFEKAIPLCGH